eukprot:CAMPEP_0173148026 /NCGR_PEP_ID=MMETSP1105-20130129/9473_1 /TAXON_ID=2985 /ORGANISM="Ochromonas sp., Strain BG-1" /LENGTH=169 /DNA_ID=CAMNT_0014062599 /DNA_START=59 /DNA_END=568 /DNA_ORIENTATION=-
MRGKRSETKGNVKASKEVQMPEKIELYCLKTECRDYQNGGYLIRHRLFKTYEGALDTKNYFLDQWMDEDDYSSNDDSDDEDSDEDAGSDDENDENEESESDKDFNCDNDGKKRKRVEREEEKRARKKARKMEKYHSSGSVYKELKNGDHIHCFIDSIELDLTNDFVCEI